MNRFVKIAGVTVLAFAAISVIGFFFASNIIHADFSGGGSSGGGGGGGGSIPSFNYYEGFESSTLGQWQATSSGYAVNEIATTTVHAGSFALHQYDLNSNSAGGGGTVQYPVPPGYDTYTIDMWIDVTQRTDAWASSLIGFTFPDGVVSWNPWGDNGSYTYTIGTGGYDYYSTVGLPKNLWHEVKVSYYAQDATVSIWVDGTLLHDHIPSGARIGEGPLFYVINEGICTPFNCAQGGIIEQYVDDVTVSGNGNTVPPVLPPTLSNLRQLGSDDITPIGEGATTTDRAIFFQGIPASPSGNQVQLQIEVRPSGDAFTDTSTQTSSFNASGQIAAIIVPGLANGGYHWQARAVDSQGNKSPWHTMNNPAANPDFTIVPTDISNTGGSQPAGGSLNCSPSLSPSIRNMVLVTHGWDDSATSTWITQMASTISQSSQIENTSDWAVCTFDWRNDAAIPWYEWMPVFSPPPTIAYQNAGVDGEQLGITLSKLHLASIHFIAHSAGANVIQNAALWVRNLSRNTSVHLTFLNAYDPSGSNSIYGLDTIDSSQNNQNWWAEQYVDMNGSPFLDDAHIALSNAYNFDVTKLDPNSLVLNAFECALSPWAPSLGQSCIYYYAVHAFPYVWYQESIDNSTVPGAYKYGFPLSLEDGLSSFPTEYAPGMQGQPCILVSGTSPACPTNAKQFSIQNTVVGNPFELQTLNASGNISISTTGNVTFPSPTAAQLQTGSPVWFEVSTTTASENNIINFNYQFLSASGAQGVLSVFIDGNLVDKIDERITPAELNMASDIPIGDLQPGPHTIGFRLDPFTNVHSIVQISNVQLGDLVVQHLTDTTPPTTTSTITGTLGKNGWHVSNVQVALNATDTGSGVQATYFSLDGAATSMGTDINITTDGMHALMFYSVDNVGNAERPTTLSIKIDKTPPQLQLIASPNILWPPNRQMTNVTVGGSASDSVSGIDSVSFSVTDEYGKAQPTISNFGDSIQLESWRNGDDLDGRFYTISAIATDKAENKVTTSVNVVVPHDLDK